MPQAVADLQALAERLGRTPTDSDIREANRAGLCPSIGALRNIFGSSGNALRIAKLPVRRRRQRVYTERICILCGSRKRVHKNRETEELVCATCAHRPQTPTFEVCTNCGHNRIVTQRTEEGPRCQTCYRHENPGKSQPKRGMCTRCKKGPQLISYLRPGTRKNICKPCYEELRARLPMALRG